METYQNLGKMNRVMIQQKVLVSLSEKKIKEEII